MDKIKNFVSKKMKTNIPKFSIGDAVKVYVKIVEGEKQRVQSYEGTVIARKNAGINESFTVRRMSYGEGVERTFLLHSPHIENIEVIKTGKVKRAKLYYLREKIGKKSKVEEKINTEAQKQPADVPPRGES